jgi:hypothetical protein
LVTLKANGVTVVAQERFFDDPFTPAALKRLAALARRWALWCFLVEREANRRGGAS